MGHHLQLAKNSEVPVDVVAVRAQIERWRKTREKKGPMPEVLWNAAVSLAEKHQAYRTAHWLKLDYGTLKARLARSQEEEVPRAAIEGFVEVDVRQLVEEPAIDGAVLDLSRADGARMTLKLPPHQPLDVTSLVAAFVRGRA